MSYELTKRQLELRTLCQSEARFILGRGGSRSGKSFAFCDFILSRALVTPNSRHGIFRKTAVECRRTLFDLTFKQMMNARFDGLWEQLKKERKINDTEMTIELPNGSIILFDGLDDSTRIDRILGNEYSTIFVNEVTQFHSFDIIQVLMSRLSQELPMKDGKKRLRPKMFLDCNPTTKRHWTYHAFYTDENKLLKVNPVDGNPWPRQNEWAQLRLNPDDNADNISSSYLRDLENLSSRERQRFLHGEWQNDNDNAIFRSEWWSNRAQKRSFDQVDDLTRIIVAVDPAGSSRAGSDETGIVVVGMDDDEKIYLLDDRSGVYKPHEWGAMVESAYLDWQADVVVAEKNYGGEMVMNTIRQVNSSIPVKAVTAMRGKTIRAEPVATIYEQGRVIHCGTFEKIEGQLEDFTIDFDRKRNGSPDRLDALVWGITELAVVEQKARGGKVEPLVNFWH